jgi:hypothetical protein
MKRFWIFALLTTGICGGIVVDEGLRTIRTHKSKAQNLNRDELFQQRLRCKSVADAYAKESSQGNVSLVAEKIEFSPSRRSCIVEFTRITAGKRAEIWSYETIDVLTGESLYSEDCIENDPKASRFCGNGRDMNLKDGRDKALADAVSQ